MALARFDHKNCSNLINLEQKCVTMYNCRINVKRNPQSWLAVLLRLDTVGDGLH